MVLDLFGTLVAAPSTVERRFAAHRFAEVLSVSPATAESVLSATWRERHDGRLKSTSDLAAEFVARCDAPASSTGELVRLLATLADDRLRADPTVMEALTTLRRSGLRLAVLSDAAPDIAEAWHRCDLASYCDVAVFSCRAGAVKPAPQLFNAVVTALRVAPEQVLYCGDGGGDELAGAERAGLHAVRVERRGAPDALVFGETVWHGGVIPRLETLPSLLHSWSQG
ncbi:HAD family hydrolase [Streptomyces sp. MS19]|uniref:HAD family hydrolase n=1 Tax=Streptomyces sp. MS19 TaxID=3385972 RepID=UPI0039A36D41